MGTGIGPEASANLKKQQEEEARARLVSQVKKDMMSPYEEYQKQLVAKEEELRKLYHQDAGLVSSGPQSAQEKKAGVKSPDYRGVVDVRTGELIDKYKMDPYQGEAMKALKEQAFAQGDSPWAKMQLQKQQMEELQGKEGAGRAQNRALAEAQGQLLRTGGVSSGARARMAMQSAKDAARAQQEVARGGMAARLGIGQQDLDRKQGLLQKFGDVETASQQANIGQLTGDINRKAMFDMERYKQQMQAYGAQQAANAQASAGGGGKK